MEREKYIGLFVDESKENLLALNEYLLELEKGSGDLRILNDIFRVAHTLKGMASTLGFKEITELTHEMENLLDFLRNAQLPVTSEIIDILFLCLDSLEMLVDNVVSTEPQLVDITNLMHRLKKLIRMGKGEPAETGTKAPFEERDTYTPEYSEEEKLLITQSIDNGYNASEIEVLLMKDSLMKAIRVLLIFQALESKAKIIKSTPSREDLNNENFGRNFVITIIHDTPPEEVKKVILSIAEVAKVYVEDLKPKFKKSLIPLSRKTYGNESLSEQQEFISSRYNHTERNVLLEAINQGFKCYEIYISLMNNTVMKAVRISMVLNLLNELGCQTIRSIPPGNELLSGNIDDNFVISIISDKSENLIKSKILTISEISQVEILDIVKPYLTGFDESTHKKIKFELPEFSNYEKLLISDANNTNKRIVLFRVHLMSGTVMKFARYVLVTKKLEGLGELIKTIPSHEEIESENFEDHFDIVFITTHKDNTIAEAISSVAEVTNIIDLLPIAQDEKGIIIHGQERQITNSLPIKPSQQTQKTTEKDIQPKKDNEESILSKLGKITPQEIIDFENKNSQDIKNISPQILPTQPSVSSSPKPEEQHPAITNSALPEDKRKKHISKKPTIRVDIERLDELINLVEELVIVRSRLTKISSNLNVSELVQSVRNLTMISGNLQNNAMRLRMVPVEQVFNRFPRMIRDISKTLNKEINFVMEGEETELDRTIIDEIGDPLVHLLRNSADHGIENAEKRVKANKSSVGNIRLIARHEGNNVLIVVEDDGGGINIDRVKQKALEKNLVSKEQLEFMTNDEIIRFILLPGFSTTETATDLSGRGVGMDAVLNKVSSIGGEINISSEMGIGTRFTIKLPLTLAIMEVLLVNVGEEIFAVPITYIEEIRELLPNEIKNINKTKVTVVRDHTIPLVNLADKLNVKPNLNPKETDPDIFDETIPIIIVRTEEGKKTSGLIVDHIIGQEDVVIKSLGRIAKDSLNYISGTANLGDGNLALILNITNLT